MNKYKKPDDYIRLRLINHSKFSHSEKQNKKTYIGYGGHMDTFDLLPIRQQRLVRLGKLKFD